VRTVEVLIGSDGVVKVKYQGFVGSACYREAERIYNHLKKLGVNVKIEQVTPTAEAYITSSTTTKVTNHV